jgi:hypothetical protein
LSADGFFPESIGNHQLKRFRSEIVGVHSWTEYRCMNPDEVHRRRERGDSISQAQLGIPISSLGLLQHDWVVCRVAGQESPRDQPWGVQGSSRVMTGRHDRSFRGPSQASAMGAL